MKGAPWSLLTPLPGDGWDLNLFKLHREAVEWDKLRNPMRGRVTEPSLGGEGLEERWRGAFPLAEEGDG